MESCEINYGNSTLIQRHITVSTSSEEEFYMQCAIAAMQGLQESGMKFSLVEDLMPKELAKMAFNIADAMLDELNRRTKTE